MLWPAIAPDNRECFKSIINRRGVTMKTVGVFYSEIFH